MKRQTYHIWICIVLLIIVVGIVIFPIIRPGFIETDDATWMVIRLSSFYQSLVDGQFPVRFLGRLNQNYGYPVANFLYPGFLYIGSFLHFLRIPFSTIIEIILITSVGIGAFGIFFWLRSFFSVLASFCGSIVFLFSPYLLYDLYKRGSVGELLAIGVMGVILYCIEKKWSVILPLLIFFLLISHNTLALFFMLFLVGYIVLRKLYALFIPLVIGGIMSSFFWIPALFEQSFVNFTASSVANSLRFFSDSTMLALLSTPFILGGILAFVFRRKRYTNEVVFFSVVFLISGIFALPFSAFLWHDGMLPRIVQFPYRFYALWIIVTPWMIAYAVELFDSWKRYAFVAACFCIGIALSFRTLSTTKSVVREEGFYTTNEGTTTVADEYMPVWVKEKQDQRPNQKVEFFQGKGTFSDVLVDTKKVTATVYAEEDSIIQINIAFYPGWGATLDDKPVEISKENLKGLIQIMVPKGDHRLLVEFRETFFRFSADVLSAVGFFLYGFFILFVVLLGKKSIGLKKPFLKDVWE